MSKSPVQGELVSKALKFCIKCHKGQFRDGENALPYAFHPITVARNVHDIGGITDENLLAAALLHDVLEDTAATFQDLESKFGPRVADWVKELTREEPTQAQTKCLDDDQIRLLRFRMLLKEVSHMSKEAQIIKLADRTDNLREAVKTRSRESALRYLDQSNQILKAIPRRVNVPLWDALLAETESAKSVLEPQAEC